MTSDEKIVKNLRKGTLTESEVYEILNHGLRYQH